MGYTTDRASSFSLSSLLCQEDASFLTDDEYSEQPTSPSDPLPFFLADDDDEYFEILVAREIETESRTLCRLTIRRLQFRAGWEVSDWMLLSGFLKFVFNF